MLLIKVPCSPISDLLMSRNSAEFVEQVGNLPQWAYGPQKCNENQAGPPNEKFILVVAKSRACPTPTVGAGHARRCMSLLDIKGE